MREAQKTDAEFLRKKRYIKMDNTNTEKCSVLVLSLFSAPQNLRRNKQRISPAKKVGFVFEKVLDLCNILWYVVVLTGGATYEQPNKRTMARKHNSARGQPNEFAGDEGTTRLHGKTSRGLGKEFHRRAEGNIRKVPRLLERVYEPRRSSYLRIRLQAGNADGNRNHYLIVKMKKQQGLIKNCPCCFFRYVLQNIY